MLIYSFVSISSPKWAPSLSQTRRISKSDSVPNLCENASASSCLLKTSLSRRGLKHRVKNSSLHKVSRDSAHPHFGMLKLQRHALSFDETSQLGQDFKHGSQVSVTFDPKPEIINIVPVHKRRERTKRSETARRHVLSRQKPIEKEDLNSPKARSIDRRPSTTSEHSFSNRPAKRIRRASSTSKSFDSRFHNPNMSSAAEISQRHQISRGAFSVPSTLSIEHEFR